LQIFLKKDNFINEIFLNHSMKDQFLVPLETYLKVGIHIGTKFKTKYMEPFIYKTRPDGLAVLNVQTINDRLKIAANFLSQYKPEEIMIACRRENGWKALKMFSELTGIKVFPGRYSPGMLTNPNLEDFTEAKVVVVADPWHDKNVVKDVMKVGIPLVALCDTNNTANNIELVVPCNNKGKKSLGLIFWILAKEYLKNTKIIKKDEDIKIKVDKFIED